MPLPTLSIGHVTLSSTCNKLHLFLGLQVLWMGEQQNLLKQHNNKLHLNLHHCLTHLKGTESYKLSRQDVEDDNDDMHSQDDLPMFQNKISNSQCTKLVDNQSIKAINNPSLIITCNSSTRAISYVNLFDRLVVDFLLNVNFFWKHLKVNQQFECMTHNNIQIGEHIHYAPYSPYGSCHVI